MQSRATGVPRAGSPAVCPGDRVVADVRLALLGVTMPLAVLGDDAAGVGPAGGRVRIPASADEIGKALAAGEVIVGDCESTPVALLTELTASVDQGWVEGLLSALDLPAELPVRRGATRVVLWATRPLTELDIESVRAVGADDVVLVVPSHGMSPDGLPAQVLTQCLELVAPEEFTLLPLPVSWRGTAVDQALADEIANALGATHQRRGRSAAETASAGAQGADALWGELLVRLRGATNELASSSDVLLSKVIPALSRWRPPRRGRGLVVFFTGFSGSGKSTLAKGLAEYLSGHVDRTVTLLDGDVVRRMLSSGLGFDRAGRDLNVRRIGFVAAEVARHGGIAVCAPIAPYAESRAAVREMVEAVGDLVLVHVATPLEECERRDVKGLYKKARAGIVTQFTGISDPYDVPLDAELRVDTTGVESEESLAVITDYLTTGGWLPAKRPEG